MNTSAGIVTRSTNVCSGVHGAYRSCNLLSAHSHGGIGQHYEQTHTVTTTDRSGLKLSEREQHPSWDHNFPRSSPMTLTHDHHLSGRGDYGSYDSWNK